MAIQTLSPEAFVIKGIEIQSYKQAVFNSLGASDTVIVTDSTCSNNINSTYLSNLRSGKPLKRVFDIARDVISQMHEVGSKMFVVTASQAFPAGNYCMSRAISDLNQKINVSAMFTHFTDLSNKTKRNIEKTFEVFEHFDFHAEMNEMSKEESKLTTADDKASFRTLQLALLYVAHLQSLMVLIHRA